MKPHTMNSPQAGELPAPIDYVYEWDSFGIRRSFSHNTYNGQPPARSFGIFTAEQMHAFRAEGISAALAGLPEQPKQPAGEPVAWRSEVIAFANAMERKLRANDWKGGWKDDASGDLMSRVHQELREFIGAHLAYPRDTDKYRADLLDEGADVANMIMMVIDVCGGLPAPPGDERAEPIVAEAIQALLVEILDHDCDDMHSVQAIARTIRAAARSALVAAPAEQEGGKTGWPPGLLQDDSRALSKWFASRPDARRRVREALADGTDGAG